MVGSPIVRLLRPPRVLKNTPAAISTDGDGVEGESGKVWDAPHVRRCNVDSMSCACVCKDGLYGGFSRRICKAKVTQHWVSDIRGSAKQKKNSPVGVMKAEDIEISYSSIGRNGSEVKEHGKQSSGPGESSCSKKRCKISKENTLRRLSLAEIPLTRYQVCTQVAVGVRAGGDAELKERILNDTNVSKAR